MCASNDSLRIIKHFKCQYIKPVGNIHLRKACFRLLSFNCWWNQDIPIMSVYTSIHFVESSNCEEVACVKPLLLSLQWLRHLTSKETKIWTKCLPVLRKNSWAVSVYEMIWQNICWNVYNMYMQCPNFISS